MFITNAWAAETEATNSETGTPAGGNGHDAGVFPPFDSSSFASQLLWLAITFGIFYYLMARVVLPRVSSILEMRRDRISRDLDEANRLKEESDATIAAYEQELAEARSRAGTIGQEARDKAKEAAQAKRDAADAELAEKLADAEAKITAMRTRAMSEVGTIASQTTGEIVKELIGGTVGKADITKAVSALRK